AVRANDGQVYVSVRQMCQALGIKRPQRQTDRIKRDEVLNDGLERVPIMGTRGRQQTYVLRVDLAPLWLAGIEASRVSENVRDKIIRYKREVAKVLWEAFQEGRLTAEPSLGELLQSDSPSAQAYRMAQAVMTLARQQLVLESRIDDHEDRLETIEAQLAPPSHAVSQSQAMQISQAVKTVAIVLGKQTKRNEFGAVYGELYRKFDVTSYKLIPASAFEEVMEWLTKWHQQLTGDEPF
ncbi:MAG: hypothetical protein GY796_34245, partial [Chloroflexi bacterium]|nr:hypothetical protein [Chloroflexota bacterium]